MNCWICGNKAETGEHKTKASDLRDLFGKNVSQKNPLFLHTDKKKNQKIGSIKSNKLKFNFSICSGCNNAGTAPYDKARENLSKFLRKNNSAIDKGAPIYLNKVFSQCVPNQILFVHLYFVKLLGCALVEHKVPIKICQFAKALIQQIPNPRVFLAFGSSSCLGRTTGLTNMETYNDITGRCVYAEFFYIVGPIAVTVIYAEPSEKQKISAHIWYPSIISANKIIWNEFEPIKKHNNLLHLTFTSPSAGSGR